MKHTIKDRLIAGLLALGWKQVEGRSSKYTTFERPGTNRRMFVGSNGALRIGRCATNSVSAQQTQLYAECLKMGDAALDPIKQYTNW